MSINPGTLVSFDRLIETPEEVLDLVDPQDQIIILRNNKLTYVITKLDASKTALKLNNSVILEKPKLTLHEAKQLFLSELRVIKCMLRT